MIKVKCLNCDRTFSFKDDAVGRTFRCQCGYTLTVQAESTVQAAPDAHGGAEGVMRDEPPPEVPPPPLDQQPLDEPVEQSYPPPPEEVLEAPMEVPRSAGQSQKSGGGRRSGVIWILAVIAIVVLLKMYSGRSSGGGGLLSGDWGSPVRAAIPGENNQVETTFLVGLKDAWWTDYSFSSIALSSAGGGEGSKPFFVVYYYKNLGPREGTFSFDNAEIKTDKGHIFSGHDLSTSTAIPLMFGAGSQTRDVGGWQPKETSAIDQTGESALVFEIPRDEAPTAVTATGPSRSVLLNVTLPHGPFDSRTYSEVFGFLPREPEKIVPGFIEALKDKDAHVRAKAIEALGKMGAAAKGAVPALTDLLLHDDYVDVRGAAARTLGDIGPAAKDAIPALREAASKPPDVKFGGAYYGGLQSACREAAVKIGSTGEAIPPGKGEGVPRTAGPVAPPQPTPPPARAPKSSGTVTAVTNGKVSVDLGTIDGVKTGGFLTVTLPIPHPITKQVIGYKKLVLKVESVKVDSAVATPEEATLPSTGDTVELGRSEGA